MRDDLTFHRLALRMVGVLWNFIVWCLMIFAPFPIGWTKTKLLFWWWRNWRENWNLIIATGVVYALGMGGLHRERMEAVRRIFDK